MKNAIIIIVISFVLVGCTAALQTGSLNDAYDNYKEEKFEEALNKVRLAENINEMTHDLKAELTYLKAQIYLKTGKTKAAETLYLYLKEQHSESQYGYLAAKRLAENTEGFN